jgi:hypothetical protein
MFRLCTLQGRIYLSFMTAMTQTDGAHAKTVADVDYDDDDPLLEPASAARWNL